MTSTLTPNSSTLLRSYIILSILCWNTYAIIITSCFSINSKCGFLSNPHRQISGYAPEVSLCLSYVDPQTLEIHKDCVGLYATERTKADTIKELILDMLLRYSLQLKNCRGQCFDGAADMAGRHAGVATKIRELESRAIYIHCMGHSMNLAVQDTCRSIAVISDAFDTVLELSKIFRYSPKKKAMLLKFKNVLAPDTPGSKPLCPTSWTVRAESLLSVLLNYNVILSVLEDIVEEYQGNSEATAGPRGVLAVMERFSFLFGVTLEEKVLSLTDSLSRAIQAKHVFAFEAKKYVAVTEAAIRDFRSDSEFKDFWQQVNRKAAELNIDEPTLPWRRKAPKVFDEANTTTHADDTPTEDSIWKLLKL